jgi:hypothetical protein
MIFLYGLTKGALKMRNYSAPLFEKEGLEELF